MKYIAAIAFLTSSGPALAQHQGHDMQMPMAEPDKDETVPQTSQKKSATDENPASENSPESNEQQPMAMDHGKMDHGSMAGSDNNNMDSMDGMGPDMGSMQNMSPMNEPPPEAFSGPDHAADKFYGEENMAPVREELGKLGAVTVSKILVERAETRITNGKDGYAWDVTAWTGGDIDKLWMKSEGEGVYGGKIEKMEVQALWSHAIAPYFDFQAGVRTDFAPVSRTYLAVGVLGLAPYRFEVDTAAFLSDKGDLTARFQGTYDQFITQRIIFQPRLEANFALQDIRETGTGAGISDIGVGARLRYEVAREFAPYIGVEWNNQLGRTARFTRTAGGDPNSLNFLIGIRAWF
jgi:copper resistance protein B